jgi:flagellar biosynthetic protein FliQ
MNEAEIIQVVRETIMLTIQLSTPIMMIGLVVGVVIALLQALTQVQEMTLVFVPKIIAIFLAVFAFLPGGITLLVAFMRTLADRMVSIQ